MTILIAIFGFILKFATGGALGGIMRYFTDKERIKTSFVARAFSSAVEAEIGMRQAVATERAALYTQSPFNRMIAGVLTLLIVGPPALHAAAIYIDTLFTWFWLPFLGWVHVNWAIAKAPEPYATAEGMICLGYIGVTTVGASIVSAAARYLRK